MDADFWKNAYRSTWDVAARRENVVAQLIKDATGVELRANGLGTGSNEFISGSANANGFVKGDADFCIPEFDIYIEVTGPLSDRVPRDSALWIRPDKIANAIANIDKGHKTFIVHHCPSADLFRCIAIDEDFVRMYANKHEFRMVYPFIRGNTEQYVEISAHHRCVRQFDYLINYIRVCVQGGSQGLDRMVKQET